MVATAWVDDIRQAYPAATADGIARLAAKRFERRAALGRLIGWTAPAEELVAHIAAAYDKQATDDDIKELSRGPRTTARAIQRFRAS